MLILCLVLLSAQPNEIILPQSMTPEESLRIDEIGQGHVITTPPNQWVETPGEFEPQKGAFVGWIYNSYNTIFREIIRECAAVGKVFLFPASASERTNMQNYLTSNGIPLDSITFMIYSKNSIWMRDYGPHFMRKQDRTEGIVDFIYNRPRPQDDSLPVFIGSQWSIPVYGSPLSHPGGNFMQDGIGTGFFSSLIYEENGGYSAAQIAAFMMQYNGLEQVVPLKRINIEYTGHIDLWTKILNDTLIMVGEYAAGHPNDTVLDNRADSLTRCKNREGFPFRVVRIPMPYSLDDAPPTYLNSFFFNKKILVPTWGVAEDTTGLRIYHDVLPGYTVVGINCSGMGGSGGAIHCITMQDPSNRWVHIRHYKLPDTSDTLNAYRVRAQMTYSGNLRPESTLVYYAVGGGSAYQTVPLTAVTDTASIFAGSIPAQHWGDTVYYYLQAKNDQSIRRTSPVDVPPHRFSFRVRSGVVVEEGNKNDFFFVLAAPNPARGRIAFTLSVPSPTPVRIDIFNVLGQKVRTFTGMARAAGPYALGLNLVDDLGNKLQTGAYFYRLVTEQNVKTGKILVLD
jgi:agmatine deiminase